jgi:RNA polymerase sigma factor (sigma-70 family)
MTTTLLPTHLDSDAALVDRSRRNDLRAFEQIVARYQTLVCSLALAAVGDVSRSEDLAQEVFLTAWQRIRELREPAKLRSWLCGIARNLAANALRRRRVTQEIDPALESSDPPPPDQAARREEQAILSRSLEKIPFIYRQPLILFYRQEQSVREVAETMALSEETIRQRLSRGRKLLQTEVSSLLENALRQSAPRRAFTVAVLAALPIAATSAKAATISAAAAKGSAVAASAGAVAWFGALLGPFIGLLGGYAGVRASLNRARTPTMRRLVWQSVRHSIAWALVCNLCLFSFIYFASTRSNWQTHPRTMAAIGIALPLIYTAWLLVMILRFNRAYRALNAEERQRHPDSYQPDPDSPISRNYQSRLTFLGLPLLTMRSGWATGQRTPPAIGWIALGDRAFGILFAAGGVAVGGISMGGISIGLISMGGVGIGLLTIGGLAIGGLCIGGAAFGVVSVGGLAAGWLGAQGGLAISHCYAAGGLAIAQHANDAAAHAAWDRYPWLNMQKPLNRTVATVLVWLPTLWFLLFWPWRRRRMSDKVSARVSS